MSRFILNIKRGKTKCDDCPFRGGYTYTGDVAEYICNMPLSIDAIIDCNKYNLNTMQISSKIIKIKNDK